MFFDIKITLSAYDRQCLQHNKNNQLCGQKHEVAHLTAKFHNLNQPRVNKLLICCVCWKKTIHKKTITGQIITYHFQVKLVMLMIILFYSLRIDIISPHKIFVTEPSKVWFRQLFQCRK